MMHIIVRQQLPASGNYPYSFTSLKNSSSIFELELYSKLKKIKIWRFLCLFIVELSFRSKLLLLLLTKYWLKWRLIKLLQGHFT